MLETASMHHVWEGSQGDGPAEGRACTHHVYPLRQSIETSSCTYSVSSSILTSAWRVHAGLTLWASALAIPEDLGSALEQSVSMV